ncbi:hypothetical protein [Nocardioides massiliensis]|uniref:ECF transporter S component n=1 Tax=Nocardioides massiliensis TaxID=1325935 RepID=A0ABT9NLQ2_9ACTN|nr:hypothetical protein [Nocardioides massiliensis]MDP9821348.1 hypothetical protein [Nocardioides massiliensis]
MTAVVDTPATSVGSTRMRRGLLCAGIGLLMLTVRLPWAGGDLTPDLVALVLLVLAGRALGTPVLTVAAALAVPLEVVGYGGLLAVVHDDGYGWWYATAAASWVLEAVITLCVLAAVLRDPRVGRWRAPTLALAAAYAVGVLTAAGLLGAGDVGGYAAGSGLALLTPLIDLGQLVVAVTAIALAGNTEGRPRR